MLKGYSVFICEKTFEDVISKQAYLKACKWLAVNVYGSEGYSENVFVQLKKIPKEKADEKAEKGEKPAERGEKTEKSEKSDKNKAEL